MFDIVGVSFLLVLAVLFGWLTRRAWKAKRPGRRYPGAVLSGLVTLVLATALTAAIIGYTKLNRKHDNPVPSVTVEVTPELVARGERFGKYCASCHAADESPPMEGRNFLGEDAPPIGTFYAPNLTPTHLADWTDGEIIRAIREGVHRNGRSLLIMPSRVLRNLSDDDIRGIVAFLRSQPPVEPDTPPNELNVVGAIMVNLAPVFEAQPPITAPVVAPPPGRTPEYGKYLASYTCAFCHGEDLRGDEDFEAPDLLGAGLGWTEEQFIEFMHSGVRPDGSSVDADTMPWEDLTEFLDDDELRAIYAYMATLET